ncbi:hypothetical protein Glove_368g36 [Diversispora epigaea]|uniref:Uncharacterized protein n=1 Tax=Diversispora epigaea TaxID=1348612 RepID=A0A397HA25_9GLOM|nr:hypothetical protein Glove_368g36 [Diversispora epigaea]
MRASGAGLCVIGRRIGIANNVQTIRLKECFDERVPSEKQAYVNLLMGEAKGITDLTLRLGYQCGRPLDISLDENPSTSISVIILNKIIFYNGGLTKC